MAIEETGAIEKPSDRCQECGAKLTPQEMRDVLENGGPVLCTIHAAEDEPGLAAAEEGGFGDF